MVRVINIPVSIIVFSLLVSSLSNAAQIVKWKDMGGLGHGIGIGTSGAVNNLTSPINSIEDIQ